ncbi:hypothetical protein TNCV_883111 [Trichonephila clavipes]|nr:hypothetical protein TNCV_883111 [Trichonephila clavipes]
MTDKVLCMLEAVWKDLPVCVIQAHFDSMSNRVRAGLTARWGSWYVVYAKTYLIGKISVSRSGAESRSVTVTRIKTDIKDEEDLPYEIKNQEQGNQYMYEEKSFDQNEKLLCVLKLLLTQCKKVGLRLPWSVDRGCKTAWSEETSMSPVDSITYGLPGNEAADELAGRGYDLSNPSSTVLTHSEIPSKEIK